MKKRNVFSSFRESILAQVERLSNIVASLGLETQAGGAGNNTRKPPFIGLLAGALSSGKQPAPEIVVGLDIGTTKIVAVAARMNQSQKVEVIGFSEAVSEGVLRGKISNIAKTTAGIKVVLEELSSQIELEIDLVTVNISGNVKTLCQRGIFTAIDSGSEIQNEDIRKLRKQISQHLLPPGEAIIYTQIQEFIVDDVDGVILWVWPVPVCVLTLKSLAALSFLLRTYISALKIPGMRFSKFGRRLWLQENQF
jgi:hypothetical protein